MGVNDKGYMGTYTWEDGVTGSQLVKVFNNYVGSHPRRGEQAHWRRGIPCDDQLRASHRGY